MFLIALGHRHSDIPHNGTKLVSYAGCMADMAELLLVASAIQHSIA